MRAISRRKGLRSRPSVGWSHAETRYPRSISSVASPALDQLCTGVIVVDYCGHTIAMNRIAESIVQRGDGLVVRDDRFGARRAFETAKLTTLVSGATCDGKSRAAPGRMLIARSDGLPPYVLTVTSLGAHLVDGPWLAMIVVVDPERYCPSGRGPCRIVWAVAGRGARCGSNDDRQKLIRHRHQFRSPNHDGANPASLDPEESRSKAAI